jgi:ethanolamine utilization protein EutQ
MKLFTSLDSSYRSWRDDPSTLIAPCVTAEISNTLACGYLQLRNTSVKSTIDFDEIIVLINGEFRSRSNDIVYDCKIGDILWIPAGSSFTLESESDALLFWAKYPAITKTPPKD